MILVHALLRIRPGAEVAYRLLIAWESIDAHVRGFRESELYARWSALLRPHFAAPPAVHHAACVTTDPRRT